MDKLLTFDMLMTFVVCSYATGWALNGYWAINEKFLDLCTFVRQFVFAPLWVTGVSGLVFLFGSFLFLIVIPNIQNIVLGVAALGGVMGLFYLIGVKLLKPAVSKAYYGVRDNVLEPISDKICIVMYKEKSKNSYE